MRKLSRNSYRICINKRYELRNIKWTSEWVFLYFKHTHISHCISDLAINVLYVLRGNNTARMQIFILKLLLIKKVNKNMLLNHYYDI